MRNISQNHVLRTLVHRGYVARGGGGLYSALSKQKKLLFGFAAQSADMPFSIEVMQSLQKAAQAAGVALMVLDNAYDKATAIRNADEFCPCESRPRRRVSD